MRDDGRGRCDDEGGDGRRVSREQRDGPSESFIKGFRRDRYGCVNEAEAAGMSQTTLSRLEKGHQSPSLEGIERIAKALGVSIAMVVDFEGEIGAPGDPIDELLRGLDAGPSELRDRLRRAMKAIFAEERVSDEATSE